MKSPTSKIIEISLVFVVFSRLGGRKGDHGRSRKPSECLGGALEGSRRVLGWSLGVLGAALKHPWADLGGPWGARGVRGGAFGHLGRPGPAGVDQNHEAFTMLL